MPTPNPPPQWRPAEELSASDKVRLEAARRRRLEPHIVTQPANTRPAIPPLRSSEDLQQGVDVSILPESAFDDYFKSEPKSSS